MPHKKLSSMDSKPSRKESKKQKEKVNPWQYVGKLKAIPERARLDKTDLAMLNCRLKYCIKTVLLKDETARDNEIYRLFGELVNKDPIFMRQWLRCYGLTNKQTVHKVGKNYLKPKGLKLKTWLSSIKAGR